MDDIKTKIELFKKEAEKIANRSNEQNKILYAFTHMNAKTRFMVTDCEGKQLNILIDSTTEVRKILLKHYKTYSGTVTAKEILSMLNIIRYGSKHYNKGNYAYIKRSFVNNKVYYTVIKLFADNSNAVLKSFHSNIGYK